MAQDDTIDEITYAIYAVNRNLKTIGEPTRKKYLYELKKKALLQLVSEGKAEKLGIHFSPNPKLCKQASDVFIVVGDFGFHIPATKADFKELPHLGERNEGKRNPKTYYPFKKAVHVLENYVVDLPKVEPEKKKPHSRGYQGGHGYFSNNGRDIFTQRKNSGSTFSRTRWGNP